MSISDPGFICDTLADGPLLLSDCGIRRRPVRELVRRGLAKCDSVEIFATPEGIRLAVNWQRVKEARHLAEQAEHPQIPHLVLRYTQARIRELTANLERLSS